jgi:hypothetical protein
MGEQDERHPGPYGAEPPEAGAQAQVTHRPSNGLGVAALVLGIVAAVLALIPVVNVLALLLGIVGFILGLVGWQRARRGQATNRGQALAGTVLSAIAVVLSVVILALVGNALGDLASEPNSEVSRAVETTGPAPTSSTEATESPTAEPTEDATPTETQDQFTPQTYMGRGDKLVRLRVPFAEPVIAVLSHHGESNFIVTTKSSTGADGEGLANEIGTWRGTKLMNVQTPADEPTAALQVQADGPWTIALRPLSAARPWNGTGTFSGRGADVILTRDVFSGLASIKATHRGESNFIVSAYGSADIASGGLINEIGNYSGEVVVPDGTVILSIEADGTWTLTKQ